MALGKKTGGRKVGTPNKISSAVKEAVVKAFDEVGGADYLKLISRSNPAVFCQLLGKLMPTEVTGEDGQEIVHRILFGRNLDDGSSDRTD